MDTTKLITFDYFDDPVGDWSKCTNCSGSIFIPLHQDSSDDYTIEYCPKCGMKITEIISDN